MNSLIRRLTWKSSSINLNRCFSVSIANNKEYSCKVLVIGGGSGGCTMAAKFARKLGKDKVVVLEPSTEHFYQPLWTLVGAGDQKLSDTMRLEESVLPRKANWLRQRATKIDPKAMKVHTDGGDIVNYEYAIIAVGLQNNYDKVPGLTEALNHPTSGVSTIYSKDYCEKTWSDLKKFDGGNAIFTFPDTPIKCPGAPQKIAYLAESHLQRTQVRSKSEIYYNTFTPVIFGVKKYANKLLEVVERKRIHVNYKTLLTEVKPDSKEAVFVNVDDSSKSFTMQYNLLHVTPPMSTPEVLKSNKELVDGAGYLDVDKYTLRHKKYENIYGIGDCTNTPNSKTGAAIAKQCYVLEQNLLATMQKNEPSAKYDGYGACPLLTSYNTCILAEFVYDGVVHETFPFGQVNAVESKLAFHMKKQLFPFVYWNFMLKGNYHGPEFVRKICNPFAK